MHKLLVIIMKKLLFIFSFLCLSAVEGYAQKTLTLKDCLEIGIENNLSLESKRKEMQKSKYGVSENRARLLPQINGFANYNDNIDPPVSVTDGSAYGNPYNITYTLRNSANAGLQLQMPLYNQTLYTTVSIAKTMDEISRLSYEKAREDLILEICKMYYLGQTTAEQVTQIKANITRLEEIKNITVAFHDNGMAKEEDVKSVKINLEQRLSRNRRLRRPVVDVGRSAAIHRIADGGMLHELILFVHHRPCTADEQNTIPGIQHPHLVRRQQFPSAHLEVGGVRPGPPFGLPVGLGVDGGLAQRLGNVLVGACLVAAQIEQRVRVTGDRFP